MLQSVLQSLLPPLLPPYEPERLELVALYLGRIMLTMYCESLEDG